MARPPWGFELTLRRWIWPRQCRGHSRSRRRLLHWAIPLMGMAVQDQAPESLTRPVAKLPPIARSDQRRYGRGLPGRHDNRIEATIAFSAMVHAFAKLHRR